MRRTTLFLTVASFLIGLGGLAVAGELNIDGVPVERVTLSDVKRSDAPVTVSKIRGSRLGDLTVACQGAGPTCTVTSSTQDRIEVLRTTVTEPPRSNTTLSLQIKAGDQMATVSVMWEDCRSCTP